jgi:hypothetical protein
LTLPNQKPDYYSRVENLIQLVSWATKTFSSYQVPVVEKTRIFQMAVFPDNIYLEANKIPVQFKWSKGCSRTLNNNTGKEDIVCYSDQRVDERWANHGIIDFDIRRHAIHEITPQFVDAYSQFPYNNTLDLIEAHCEVMPRISAGLQKDLPDSTKFLLNLTSDDLIVMQDLAQNGFANYSAEPVSENAAYGSAFLAGVNIAYNLGIDQSEEVDYRKGIQKWYDLVWQSTTPTELRENIALAINKPYEWLYLRDFVSAEENTWAID